MRRGEAGVPRSGGRSRPAPRPAAARRRLSRLRRGSKVGRSPPAAEGGVSAREAPAGLCVCPAPSSAAAVGQLRGGAAAPGPGGGGKAVPAECPWSCGRR